MYVYIPVRTFNSLINFLLSPLQGCLSSWFRAHPDLLQAVLPIILDGLTNVSLASSAALAFRDVCGECAEHLAPAVMQIIPACQVIVSGVLYHMQCTRVYICTCTFVDTT